MTDETAPANGDGGGQRALAVAVAGLLSQVGCVTLVLIGIALGAGLWLDAQFSTRPLFTVLFILGSVPITLYLMVRLVLGGMARLQAAGGVVGEARESNEEAEVGGTE